MVGNVQRLGLFESFAAMPLAGRVAGTYQVGFLTEGNSLVSTVFVESIDPGASIKVNWWDFTLGGDEGERYDLRGHPLITSAGMFPKSDRQVVSRIHNKPVLEAIVTGGSAVFSVYVTVVSSFAADTGAGIVAEGQATSTDDRGGPFAILDPVQEKWFFAQGQGGVLDVNVAGGTISADGTAITGVYSGAAALLPYGSSADLFTATPSGTIMIPEVVGSGDADGEFRLYVGGTLWGVRRNSWQQREASFKPGSIKVMAGTEVKLSVTNVAQSGGLASFEGFAYFGT